MQEAKQRFDQFKIQMLDEKTKSQYFYTEEEEKIRCLSKGISAYGLNNIFVA